MCSDGKEMYKKAWCTCKVVVAFFQSKHIAFLSFSLLLLKLPDVFTGFDSDKLSPGVLDWLLGEYELTG